ncbi:malate dehydrogenase MDH2 KNAG_0A01340 [Huiozyma naganishii CBS 8797]|uniref:Malate dehydrogenase n=1 Tax=Huiozyma naganishii (strain ATCC MYA-139 / BCRC 22969 / CBS 8797 / KCTC 17520 / NBRC 10181 / NCYC 3082 / Yp74L-3) TaxID=1071383 RepID=J7RE37_HUIN7|nr:hypothetical protein KNAG_0A01340 [Kazachstania naganishii CBS 8797]CCK67823.1 hypothetical protein KNAG_0A01340 [Kazachstania naganishii CBS 8797]
MPHQVIEQGDGLKVSVLGAAGGIGQSLSLLLKTQLQFLLRGADCDSKRLSLALFDVNKEAIDGVATDLSHIDTPVEVSAHSPQSGDSAGIGSCLENADVVIIPAGMPRKPGMTRDDLFNINAKIVAQLTDSIAEHCDLRKVFVLVISNPVNALVPVMHHRLRTKHQGRVRGTGIERRVFGVTKLDIVRASTFLREVVNKDSTNTMPFVPVIGGHSGETIIPLFSQNELSEQLTKEQRDFLVNRVQYGGDEVVKAKNGKGSATLSMAHAAFKCAQDFINVILGNTKEINTINFGSLLDFEGRPIAHGAEKLLNAVDNCSFFAVPMTVTREGVQSVDYTIVSRMDAAEKNEMLPLCVSKLKKNVANGETFAVQLV